MWKKIFESKPVTVAFVILIFAISISFVFLSHATTPNPGHPWTDIGNGTFIVANTQTATRTFTFPDMNATILTGSTSLIYAQRTITGNTTLSTSTDETIFSNGTASLTITLPDATLVPGMVFNLEKIDTTLGGLVNVTTSVASQGIDGASSTYLANRAQRLAVESDGSIWRTVDSSHYDISSYRAMGSTLNQWYTSPTNGGALTTGAATQNSLRVTPMIITKPTTIDNLAVDVTTLAASSSLRVGIYADNGNLYPGNLVVDGGSLSGTSAVVVTTTTNLPITLSPGLYWLATNASGTPTLRSFAVADMNPVLGFSSSLPTTPSLGWSVASTFVGVAGYTLPTTYPAGGAVITAVPITTLFYRVSK